MPPTTLTGSSVHTAIPVSSVPNSDTVQQPRQLLKSASLNNGADGADLYQQQRVVGSLSRASSESAITMYGNAVDRNIALANEQCVRDEMASLGTAMRLLTRLVSRPITGTSTGADSTNTQQQEQETATGTSNIPVLIRDEADLSGSAYDDNITDDQQTDQQQHPITEEHSLEEINNLLSYSDYLSTSTPFPALLNSCVMLRDALRLTALEADEALAEAQQAREDKIAAEDRLAEAHDTVASLRHENGKLRSERKSLARQIKSYVGNVEHEKERELNEAYAFITHEMVLASPNRMGKTPQQQHHKRHKTPIDGLQQDDELLLCNDGFRDALANNTVSHPKTPTLHTMHHKTPTRKTPTSTLHSRSRTQSTEWKATVIISPDVYDRKQQQQQGDDCSIASTNTGLASNITETVEADEEEEEDELIPAGDFLSARMNDDELISRDLYHIHFPTSKVGLELMAIPVPKSQNTQQGGGFIAYKHCKDAFIITGYKDYTQPKRPELGGRLVAMDGESLEYGNWCLRKIGERIRSKKCGGIKLSFRNDPLPEDMVNFLNRKVKPMSSKSVGEADESHFVLVKGEDKAAHRRAASTPKIPLLDITNDAKANAVPSARQESGCGGGSGWRSPSALTRKLSRVGSNHSRKCGSSSVVFPIQPAKQ